MVRWVRRISTVVWAFSWFTIYREIFVWHHMTKTLRFQAPPAPPGSTTQPKAGLPLIAVCVTSVAAPLLVIATTIALKRGRDPK